MSNGQKRWLRWLSLAGSTALLMGEVASAGQPRCIRVFACGCDADGSYIYCSEYC
jgi:hypothetical protein